MGLSLLHRDLGAGEICDIHSVEYRHGCQPCISDIQGGIVRVILRIALGIGTIILGIAIYPYYVTSFIEPMQGVIEALFPSLNVWENAFVDALPLIVLLIIIFCGMMHLLGKVGHKDESGES